VPYDIENFGMPLWFQQSCAVERSTSGLAGVPDTGPR
jgi:hypothetical protein